MARAIWTGSLSFGLVNVPVGLYSATEDKTVHFHQFQRGTSSRIRYQRVNEDTGKEVAYKEIVKGAEVGDDQYVILTPEELEEVEPGRSRTIDISDFVDASEIDPIYYQKTYYVAPQDEAGERAYALLLQAMREADRVGIATFVMRSKQYLAAIRPQDNVLALETMYFGDEVRDPTRELDRLPSGKSPRKKDLDMAISLIDAMTTTWDPENYRDNYRDRIDQLIQAKRRNEEIVTEHEPEEREKVVDLIGALQASIERSRGEHRPGNRRQAEQKLQTRGAGGDDARGGKKSSGGSDDVANLSKKQLYDLATELDVPGRSKMSRADLADAVAKAGRRARKKAS